MACLVSGRHKALLAAGHSLGGALATLCAYDVAAAIRDSASAGRTAMPAHVEVSCYTFGAPRTGNKAFMKDYNALIPDSWAIINDQVTERVCPHRQRGPSLV